MTDTSKALELAAQLLEPMPDFPEPTTLERDAANELRRLAQQEFSLKEWFSKTDWVRPTLQPSELGMHIADVLKVRIAELKAELERIRALQPVGIIDENGRAWAYSNHGGRFELPSGTRVYTLPPNLKG